MLLNLRSLIYIFINFKFLIYITIITHYVVCVCVRVEGGEISKRIRGIFMIC